MRRSVENAVLVKNAVLVVAVRGGGGRGGGGGGPAAGALGERRRRGASSGGICSADSRERFMLCTEAEEGIRRGMLDQTGGEGRLSLTGRLLLPVWPRLPEHADAVHQRERARYALP